ncbi:MAG: hypothetical protein IJ061_05025 [Lachnospiraceae bacterium]|nr:hypothetical protein [Lachnospiraceae bacterium]
MATKKTVEKAAQAAVAEVKKAEAVVEEKKTEVKAEAKAEAEAAKKPAAKKAPAKKAAPAKKFEPKKTSVVFQADGKEFDCDEVVKNVMKACKGKTAKKLEIYVNANEGAAYYVLDGEGSAEYKVQL